jgi:hypothetical protein
MVVLSGNDMSSLDGYYYHGTDEITESNKGWVPFTLSKRQSGSILLYQRWGIMLALAGK